LFIIKTIAFKNILNYNPKSLMTKIFIVDDHSLFREGLAYLLSQIEGLSVIGGASDGKEFIEMIENGDLPDLVLMDITMPFMDGIEACKQAISKYPDLKILALSMNDEQEYYMKMIQAGAKGFVQKQADKEELAMAISEVVSGGSYFPEDLLRKIIIKMGNKDSISKKAINAYNLTNRELEVLSYICQGHTNAEIAEKMFLSQKTIEGHRANLLSKTETKNSAHLVMFSIKNGIIKL
jgi:DNA-binding NarL/FixJ family response regulator